MRSGEEAVQLTGGVIPYEDHDHGTMQLGISTYVSFGFVVDVPRPTRMVCSKTSDQYDRSSVTDWQTDRVPFAKMAEINAPPNERVH